MESFTAHNDRFETLSQCDTAYYVTWRDPTAPSDVSQLVV